MVSRSKILNLNHSVHQVKLRDLQEGRQPQPGAKVQAQTVTLMSFPGLLPPPAPRDPSSGHDIQEPLFHTALNPTPQLLQLNPALPPRSEGGPATVRRSSGLDGGVQGPGFMCRLSWKPHRATSPLCTGTFPSVNGGRLGQMLKANVGHNMQDLL